MIIRAMTFVAGDTVQNATPADFAKMVDAMAKLSNELREEKILAALEAAGVPRPDPSWSNAQIKAHLRLHMTRIVTVDMGDGEIVVVTP